MTFAPVSPQGHMDSLRGWAAFSVLIMHTFGQRLLPEFPGSNYTGYLQADRAAVLLFFVISGYVIGLGGGRPWTPAAARDYGWRRVVRIGPVYLLAVLLAWIAVPAESWRTLLGHLFFLQDSHADNPLRVNNLAGNTPLWSLHYEVFYYVLFLAWWRWPATVGPSLLLALAGAVWATVSPAGPGFLISHSVGAIYWLAGLCLARCAPAENPNVTGRIWAGVLWLHAVYHFAPVALVRAGLQLAPGNKSSVPLDDLIYLPLTVLLVALAGGRKLPCARWWQWAALGTAAAGLFIVLAAGKDLREARWLVATGYLGAGLFCFFRPVGAGLGVAARVGTFSYALYALHFPLLMMLGRLWPAQTSVAPGLAAVALAWAGVIPLAWWLERRMQPRLRAWLIAR